MSKNAIISVSNKEGIKELSVFLIKNGFIIYSTGGTFNKIRECNPKHPESIKQISDLTKFPEILCGRVKTLHPVVYGGILVNLDSEEHIEETTMLNIPIFSLVVVNLYPFQEQNCIENIDIGGVSLIRAAAKNHAHVSILSNPSQYQQYMISYPNISTEMRKSYALAGFQHTSSYDNAIVNYFLD